MAVIAGTANGWQNGASQGISGKEGVRYGLYEKGTDLSPVTRRRSGRRIGTCTSRFLQERWRAGNPLRRWSRHRYIRILGFGAGGGGKSQIEAFKTHILKLLSSRRSSPGRTTGRSCKRPSPAVKHLMSSGSTRPVSPSMLQNAWYRSTHRRGWDRSQCVPRSAGRDVSYKDVQYGLPRDFDTIALFFNKDLFDAAGVDYPDDTWTWEFRAAAEKLTNKDKGIWGAGMQTSWQENYYNFIWQNGGRLLNEDRTKCVVDEPAACEAFDYPNRFFTDELTPSIASSSRIRWPTRCSRPARWQ